MEKLIFTRKMALYLRQRGFQIIRTEPNWCKPQFDVYVFADTPALREAISDYSSNPQK